MRNIFPRFRKIQEKSSNVGLSIKYEDVRQDWFSFHISALDAYQLLSLIDRTLHRVYVLELLRFQVLAAFKFRVR